MAHPMPDRVERQLSWTLDSLRSIHDIILDTRKTLDIAWGGNGRYEADAYLNTVQKISDGMRYLTEFRRICATKDIDAEAAIFRLGGVPTFEISAGAMDWLERDPSWPTIRAVIDGSIEETHP